MPVLQYERDTERQTSFVLSTSHGTTKRNGNVLLINAPPNQSMKACIAGPSVSSAAQLSVRAKNSSIMKSTLSSVSIPQPVTRPDTNMRQNDDDSDVSDDLEIYNEGLVGSIRSKRTSMLTEKGERRRSGYAPDNITKQSNFESVDEDHFQYADLKNAHNATKASVHGLQKEKKRLHCGLQCSR